MSKKALEDVDQYLLQQFLNNGVLDQYNFKDLFKSILTKFQINYDPDDNSRFKSLIVTHIKSINDAIKPLSMEIKIGTCEVTGVTFYCLVRLYDTNGMGTVSQLYNSNELKIFKKILNLIIESDCGSVELNHVIMIVAEDSSIKASNKDVRQTIEKFIKDYWLVSTADHKIALHGRAIIELSQYLVEVYGEQSVSRCNLCKQIVIVSVPCESCGIKLHKHCARRYFQSQTDCPSCKIPFDEEQITSIRDKTFTAASNKKLSQTQNNTEESPTQKKKKEIKKKIIFSLN